MYRDPIGSNNTVLQILNPRFSNLPKTESNNNLFLQSPNSPYSPIPQSSGYLLENSSDQTSDLGRVKREVSQGCYTHIGTLDNIMEYFITISCQSQVSNIWK